MPEIRFEHIEKYYSKDNHVVFDFNLDVKDKEFIVLVGPSGCGKSTTLRMVAGLEDITSGELYIDGRLVNDVQSKDRGISMVFQSYALFPNLSVRRNISYGLEIRKVPVVVKKKVYSKKEQKWIEEEKTVLKKMPKEEIKKRVDEVAEILGLTPYLERKPKALSGGQKQRVALGRSIVRDAKVFLMDEPLSNLDAKLRVHMRKEIIDLHRRLGSTTLYVTHDQLEAMTMADRIVIMNKGVIQQIGTPEEVYNHPKNRFVAAFIGSPTMNFFKGTLKDGLLCIGNQSIELPSFLKERYASYQEQELTFGIRLEDVLEDEKGPFLGKITMVELMGNDCVLHVDFEGKPLTIYYDKEKVFTIGDEVRFNFRYEKLHAFDKEDNTIQEGE